jgi:hypothetical protein
MATKKLYVFYAGEWSATVQGFVRTEPERKKGEKLDKFVVIDTAKGAEEQRCEVWAQVMPNVDTIELGRLIYTLRIYRAVCQKLGVFIKPDDYTPFAPEDLEISNKTQVELFFQTVEETFGPAAAAAQRKALLPAKSVKEIDAALPKLPPIKLPATGKQPSVKEIVGNYTMLALTIHGIGNRRKVSADALREGEEQADKEWLAVSKRLLESDELRDINYTGAKCREYIENRSLPSLVKKGIYIMRRELVEAAIARITEDNQKIEQQAEILVRAYPALLAEAKKRLKKEFNESDYPKAADLKRRFSISYQLLEIRPPQAEKMSDKIFREEKAKWEKLWSEAAANADTLLTVGMIEQMDLLSAKLQNGNDAKSKQIRPTALDSITEFLNTFSPRNMQNNQQLEAAKNRIAEIIKGVSPEVLRQSKNARQYVTEGFSQIKKVLEPMIEKKPTRAISLQED